MDNQTIFSFLFTTIPRNSSYVIPGIYDITDEDANWVLISSFIIFTMQTGFAMVESGCVSVKNEANIMMKNIIDMVFGGFTFWAVGYGLAFGRGTYSTPFFGLGDFLLNPKIQDPLMGSIFTAFLFQLSFATTATTIVSGALAERCNFKAYCIFSFLNSLVYSIPAGWVWGDHGFLHSLGVVDIAGTGPVHLVGGSASFAAAFILGPRLGRYTNGRASLQMGSPGKACIGLFVLWFGWLAFNSGSTYGITGIKWEYAARSAVCTMLSSFGGGMMSIVYSMTRYGGRLQVSDLINGVISALVSITAGCFLYNGWEAVMIGAIGALLTLVVTPLVDRLNIDDPLGSSAVHGIGGIWGVIAVGLFADNPIPLTTTGGRRGLFKGGGWHLLKIQSLAAVSLAIWGMVSTYMILWTINKFISIRMDPNEELLGADIVEHFALPEGGNSQSPLKSNNQELSQITTKLGSTNGYEQELEEIRLAAQNLEKMCLDILGPYQRKSINVASGRNSLCTPNLFHRHKTTTNKPGQASLVNETQQTNGKYSHPPSEVIGIRL